MSATYGTATYGTWTYGADDEITVIPGPVTAFASAGARATAADSGSVTAANGGTVA